eukprot:jgi/Tetstr1/444083/TSEL_003321.t1
MPGQRVGLVTRSCRGSLVLEDVYNPSHARARWARDPLLQRFAEAAGPQRPAPLTPGHPGLAWGSNLFIVKRC